MKKSELYHIAMLCVLDSEYNQEIRLEVLKMLQDNKDTAVFCEERAEKEAAE